MRERQLKQRETAKGERAKGDRASLRTQSQLKETELAWSGFRGRSAVIRGAMGLSPHWTYQGVTDAYRAFIIMSFPDLKGC